MKTIEKVVLALCGCTAILTELGIANSIKADKEFKEKERKLNESLEAEKEKAMRHLKEEWERHDKLIKDYDESQKKYREMLEEEKRRVEESGAE